MQYKYYMLPITESPDFKRVGDTVEAGYYDISLFNRENAYEVKGTIAMDQALENYLLTIPGERLFNIAFGSPLYLMLFQKNNDQDELREQIYRTVENTMNISIDRDSAYVSGTDDPHVLQIHFKYSTNDGVITNHEFSRRFSR